MTLAELHKQIEQLPKLPDRTPVSILVDTKSGRVYVPVFDVRFDGMRVIIEDGGLRW